LSREREDETMAATDELTVLRAFGLKGRATPEELSAATGVPVEVVTSLMDGLVTSGGAKEMRGALFLLPPARERLEELLAAERAGVDQAAVRASYERFTRVNDDFKALANDWQTRGGEINDHTDSTYDQAVLDRLPDIHARVTPIVGRVAERVPRLARYGDRLADALRKVQSGEHEWLLKPLIDSYHTVWFELHEELIALAGLTRLEEATAGRAS
jgi:pyruvate,orthophosphate dikinase